MPRMMPPTTVSNPMIAVTNDAMPSPFCGALGGGAYPAYGCGGGGG